jgi:hypothetical protein
VIVDMSAVLALENFDTVTSAIKGAITILIGLLVCIYLYEKVASNEYFQS